MNLDKVFEALNMALKKKIAKLEVELAKYKSETAGGKYAN